MKYKCINCSWEGEELTKSKEARLDNKCPVCGDEVQVIENKYNRPEPEQGRKVKFDFDGDGDFDKDDVSIAAKAMAKSRNKKSTKKSGGKK